MGVCVCVVLSFRFYELCLVRFFGLVALEDVVSFTIPMIE